MKLRLWPIILWGLYEPFDSGLHGPNFIWTNRLMRVNHKSWNVYHRALTAHLALACRIWCIWWNGKKRIFVFCQFFMASPFSLTPTLRSGKMTSQLGTSARYYLCSVFPWFCVLLTVCLVPSLIWSIHDSRSNPSSCFVIVVYACNSRNVLFKILGMSSCFVYLYFGITLSIGSFVYFIFSIVLLPWIDLKAWEYFILWVLNFLLKLW